MFKILDAALKKYAGLHTDSMISRPYIAAALAEQITAVLFAAELFPLGLRLAASRAMAAAAVSYTSSRMTDMSLVTGRRRVSFQKIHSAPSIVTILLLVTWRLDTAVSNDARTAYLRNESHWRRACGWLATL